MMQSASTHRYVISAFAQTSIASAMPFFRTIPLRFNEPHSPRTSMFCCPDSIAVPDSRCYWVLRSARGGFVLWHINFWYQWTGDLSATVLSRKGLWYVHGFHHTVLATLLQDRNWLMYPLCAFVDNSVVNHWKEQVCLRWKVEHSVWQGTLW